MVFFLKNNIRLVWSDLLSLIRFHQPIGFFLFLWPTLWALWLSKKKIPDYHILVFFIIGVFLMRSVGCIINDYIDKDIDRYILRTSNRPLSSGRVGIVEVLVLFFGLLFFSFIILVILGLSMQTFLFSFIVLILTCIYPYTKRCLSFPQLFLGITFGSSTFIVFSVMDVSLCDFLPWLLFLINIIWTIVYDTEYAMVDRDDDIFFSIKSFAVYFGNYETIFIGILQLIMLFLLIVLGVSIKLGMVFYFSLIGVAILFIWQQILIVNRNRNKCFRAFLSNNYVGMLLFLGIFLDLLIY